MLTLKVDGNCQVRIIQRPDPAPGPSQVVIGVAVSALCDTELHAYQG